MKRLLILTILLMSTIWSAHAGTRYSPTANRSDSCMTASGERGAGFARNNSKMVMYSNGNLGVSYGHQNASGSRIRMFYTNNWGTDWSVSDSTTVGVLARAEAANAIGSWYSGFHAFGDSSFLWNGGDSVGGTAQDYSLLVRAFNSTFVRGALDTVDGRAGSSSGKADGLTVVNGDLLVMHNKESGSNDSIYAWLTQGAFSSASTWTKVDSVVRAATPVWAAGQRVPFTWTGDVGGGILCWAPTADDVYWIDTAGGFDTLSSAFLGAASTIYASWIIQTSGKSGIVVWESTNGGPTAVLYARPFTIASADWSTTPNRTIGFDAAATTLATGLTLRNLTYAYPVASMLKGSGADDSVFAIWKDEPDTSGTNWLNRRFSYSISGDLGATWGSRQTLYTFPATDTVVQLQAPYNIYRSGNDIRLAVGWCDSVSTASAEGVNVYLEAITTTPPATASSNVVVRGSEIRGTVIR